MKQITKIKVTNGNIQILNSSKILDKRTHYHIYFDEYYLGYCDYYVNKSEIGKIYIGHLESNLYVSTDKFNKNKDTFLYEVVKLFKDVYGKFDWFIEPTIK